MMAHDGTGEPREVPPAAAQVFGARLPLAVRYVELLASTGITHGLLGPREAPRLWDRHVLNSAVIHPLFGEGATVADVGSGAGLPGIPLAIARPDLTVSLVEPLLRRTRWLEASVSGLGLENVTVVRGRAEALWGSRRFEHVTARAVARIRELARLTLPLLSSGGSLHALKGEQADAELAEDAETLAALGARTWSVTRLGRGLVTPEAVVVSIVVGGEPPVPAALARPRPTSEPRAPGRGRSREG